MLLNSGTTVLLSSRSVRAVPRAMPWHFTAGTGRRLSRHRLRTHSRETPARRKSLESEILPCQAPPVGLFDRERGNQR